MKTELNIDTHIMDSPIGTIRLYAVGNYIVRLITEKEKWDPSHQPLETALTKKTATLAWAEQELCHYFAGKTMSFSVPILLQGTNFQKRVWQELQAIPAGRLSSYSDIAIKIQLPNAVRAVGAANGKNPIPIIVPCHRVIGKTGHLTGFAGGLETKTWLLRHEGHNIRDLRIKGNLP